MTFLQWLVGFILLSWIIGIIFKIGGNLINLLLLVAALVFIIDVIFGKGKSIR